ncbi:MAG: permease, partial [Betaproteobacteria bacterium]|nr:permease [Betaproteobacteria bacterium]
MNAPVSTAPPSERASPAAWRAWLPALLYVGAWFPLYWLLEPATAAFTGWLAGLLHIAASSHLYS